MTIWIVLVIVVLVICCAIYLFVAGTFFFGVIIERAEKGDLVWYDWLIAIGCGIINPIIILVMIGQYCYEKKYPIIQSQRA